MVTIRRPYIVASGHEQFYPNIIAIYCVNEHCSHIDPRKLIIFRILAGGDL